MYERFEKRAEELLLELKINRVPVPLEQITDQLNIEVRRAPSDEFSGLLIRKQDAALIGINSQEPVQRQRFTVAHEIGHYVLDQNKHAFVDYVDSVEFRENGSGRGKGEKETRANAFAAALLMPRTHLLNDLKKIKRRGDILEPDNIDKLAQKYGVSGEAMKYRIINLV